ncbi:MAG TPA: hypothetical protein V6D17_18440 [Candidatus Obscuribacterales bacterium]
MRHKHTMIVNLCLLIFVMACQAAAAQGNNGTSLCDQQKCWNKNNQQSQQYDQNDQGRPKSGCSKEGKVLMSKPAGEKTLGVKYLFQMDAAESNQTKTEQCGSGTKPWDETKKQDPIGQLQDNPVTNLGAAISEDFEAATKMDRSRSPEATMAGAQAAMHSQAQGASEACAEGTVKGLIKALAVIKMSLPNIANEASGTSSPTIVPFRTLSDGIGMVQKAYKNIFLPMALLLLLPGAVLTQIKSLTSVSILGNGGEESHPFSGILRSVVAIMLIPGTQLILSYAIDVGNSMTNEVCKHISGPGLVIAAAAIKTQTNEAEMYGDQAFHMVQNMMDMFLLYGLVMLMAFQIVMTCYLYLMGPIAAAFFAWPSAVGRLFKPVFNNWLDAIVTLTLWKFWWCLLIVVMLLRIEWLASMGLYDPTSIWEGFMFTAFLVMMGYVPFAPFELKPGEMVDKVMEKAEKMGASAAKSGG